jgi:hypothetical protein
MGHEYRIAWTPTDLEGAKARLRRLGGRPVVFEKRERFEFRFQSADDTKMPDALVAFEETGVYFCDFFRSDRTAAILREIIDEALAHSDSSDSVVVRSL